MDGLNNPKFDGWQESATAATLCQLNDQPIITVQKSLICYINAKLICYDLCSREIL
jgi:hypothetical protein